MGRVGVKYLATGTANLDLSEARRDRRHGPNLRGLEQPYIRGVKLTFAVATPADAAAIGALRTEVAMELDRMHGRGHWSSGVTEKSVLRGIQTSHVLLAREGEVLVATLRLATKKPWAIDPVYFQKVSKALYLTDMAVAPGRQRRGLGRQLLREVGRVIYRKAPLIYYELLL
jgi:ribosomal protein S18 acetylase RimI-like enzyme